MSALTLFLAWICVLPASGNLQNPTPAEVTRAEEDWTKAQQDFYEALRREPRATPARVQELRREILEPKKKTLDEFQTNFQLRQRPEPLNGTVASPAPALESTPAAPATQPETAEGTIEEALPAPDPVTVVEYGKSASPAPSPSTKFTIEEVTSESPAVDFKTQKKK